MRLQRARRTFERVTVAPARPVLITDATLVTDEAVWAWVQVPPASTYLLEDQELTQATWQTATALGSLLPTGAEFHLNVLWTSHSPRDYMASWDAVPGARAPAAQDYVALGAHRIARNSADGYFRRRVVLLGLRVDQVGSSLPERAERAARRGLAIPGSLRGDAGRRWRRSRDTVQRCCADLAGSPLRAVPAPAGLIAWAYARQWRRSGPGHDLGHVDLAGLAGGGLAGPVLVELAHGEVDPGQDPNHVVVTDLATGRCRFVTVLAAAVNGFPPAELRLPGGEWLELLAGLDGVQASVRGVCHGQAGSIALLDEGRKIARSQAREAGEHGVAAPLEVTEADAALQLRRHEVQRRLDVLATVHPRWVVEAADPVQLADRVAALRQRYTGLVRLEPVPHVQDLLWQELLPGDRVRVPEFGQFQPLRTLAGSWFHGGSVVGDDTGPYVGANLGSTPGPVRLHLVSRAGADRVRPTSVSFTGASGSGKSTAVMLTVLGALAEGAWALLADPKGDLRGVAETARRLLGVPVQEVDLVDERCSGMLDPMRVSPGPDQARALTLDALLGALRTEDRRRAEPLLEAAVDGVLSLPAEVWSGQRVLTELCTTPMERPGARQARELGEQLRRRAKHPALRCVLGPLAPDAQPLHTGRGLVYMGLAGLMLPRHTPDPQHWTVAERCAMTAFRTALHYALLVSGRARETKKLVALTELHLITAYPEGKAMVEWLARTGRAMQTWLLLDSQAAVDLATVTGLVEQLVMSLAFRATGDTERDAQAQLLGRPHAGPRLRQAQASLGTGECVLRDRHGRLGIIAFDRLATWIAQTLSTDAADDPGDATAASIAEDPPGADRHDGDDGELLPTELVRP